MPYRHIFIWWNYVASGGYVLTWICHLQPKELYISIVVSAIKNYVFPGLDRR